MSSSAWRSLVRDWSPPDPSWLSRPSEEVARDLLGCRLVSIVGARATGGRIVETEAYGGADDPASHAATLAGRTPRNESMFGPAGRAYVYFVYGMHWCFNVVTGAAGDPQAVLIRALEPDVGRDVMARRRGRPRDLTNGPARLCAALGIEGCYDGHDLGTPPLLLLAGGLRPAETVGTSGRIGVRRAADRPLRYFVEGHPDVSVRPRGVTTTPGRSPSG